MVLREIKQLFMEPNTDSNPFSAGFGNKDSDALAYSSVGIQKNRVFIINPKGDIYQFGSGMVSSYPKLNESVDEMFPFIDSDSSDHISYNDASYWRTDLSDLYELDVLQELEKD